MLDRLCSLVLRHRRGVFAAWAVVFALGLVAAGGLFSSLDADLDGSSRLESERAGRRLAELAPGGGEVVAIVEDATVAPAVLDGLRAVDGVTDVQAGPSDDGRATGIVVSLAGGLGDDRHDALVDDVAARLRAIDAPEVLVGGELLLDEEVGEIAERDAQRAESIALPVTLIVMAVVFGGLLAAGMPLAIALCGVGATSLALTVVAALTDVSVYALNVTIMLGLGLGIDYGLLLVTRFREERRAVGSEAAVRPTMATAGRTVVFSASTVAVALAALLVFDDPTIRSLGFAGIAVVVTTMAAALTLLPALLGAFGHRLRGPTPAPAPAPVPTPTPALAAGAGAAGLGVPELGTSGVARSSGSLDSRASDADERGWFAGVARVVQRRAAVVAVVVGGGLAVLAVPFLGARFDDPGVKALPRSSETRAVAEAVDERFSSVTAEPVDVVADVDPSDPEVATWVAEVADLPGVRAATIDEGTSRPGTTVVEVHAAGPSNGPTAQRVVTEVRDLDAPFPVLVGGDPAEIVDFRRSIASRLPLAIGIVVASTFVLLFLMTGSVLVPLKAIVMNVLSLGATFGALVWVFQDGHLSGLLGFDPPGSLDFVMPVIVFVFGFGLSMDYEVFLLARIREVWLETGDSDRAVAVGLQRSGRIITSAALLIVIVFAGFAAGEIVPLKQLGLGLALAVVVDATIVRTLLVPATMTLLGRRNWWAPQPLARLHNRLALREA
jgi:RND superfamily putative drug exporter